MTKKYKIKKYLDHDLFSLHDILEKFQNIFYKKFMFDPLKCMTISSLTKYYYFNKY